MLSWINQNGTILSLRFLRRDLEVQQCIVGCVCVGHVVGSASAVTASAVTASAVTASAVTDFIEILFVVGLGEADGKGLQGKKRLSRVSLEMLVGMTDLATRLWIQWVYFGAILGTLVP